jgi:hypothetical protein
MQTLTSALNLYNEDQGGTTGYSLGTPGTIYLSAPDPTATTAGNNCSGLGLPVSSTTYHCAASSTYRKTDGTGWIPVNFASSTMGSPLGSLPVDPTNATSSGEYYQYATDGINFEIVGTPESQKYSSASSSFAVGSSRTLIALASSTGGSANCAASPFVVTSTGAGSCTVPTGVNFIQVELWGGGGGGGVAVGSAGAGAYVIETSLSVTPGNSITYVIASGGNGGNLTTGGTGGAGYMSGGNGANGGIDGGGGGGGSSAVSSTGWTYIASGGGGGNYGSGTQGASTNVGGNGGTGNSNYGGGGGGGSGGRGGNASGGTGGTGGTGGSTQTGTNGNGIGSAARGGGSSAGATGNGFTASSTTGATGSGGAAGGIYPGGNGANGSGSNSGGGGAPGAYASTGGAGGQPGAGAGGGGTAGVGGTGGAGELIITYTH